ncbi:MAG TPA: substrate-binding domain-containing protein [Chthoniobacteraceae bacterium]|nr:substrate-binding domain-containing protein [Chthoniobacteraceae bacterium]
MQVYSESRRPSERTEQFLRDYVSKYHRLSGERLPSPRQIAAELQVSEGTVRGVIRKWLNEGRLRSRQGSGIFICEAPQSERVLRIGSNVRSGSSPDQHQWGDLIHLNVLEAILELGPGKSFASLYSASEEIDALSSEAVARRCLHLDGIILRMTDPHSQAIIRFCQEHKKPFVSLNPMDDDTVSNFVGLGHFTSFYRTSRALRDAGRRRFAVLISPALERSAAIRQRLSGFMNGIGAAMGDTVEVRIITCAGFKEPDGYEATRKLWLKGAFAPDAILTAGDHLAIGAMQALGELKVSVPQQTAVIAGAGFHPLLEEYQLTTLLHPLQDFGRNLVGALVEMLEKETLETPARILPIGLRTGGTTTKQESRCLEALFAGST